MTARDGEHWRTKLDTHLRALLERATSAEADEVMSVLVLVRQVLGAVSQFEKASLVTKLAAARKRQRRERGKCEGRKGYRETRPAMVERARVLRREGQTLAQVAAVLAAEGMMASTGRPFAPGQIARLLTAEDKRISKQHRRPQPMPSQRLQ